MHQDYTLVVLMLAAVYPSASFCAEQTAQGWVAPPFFVEKLEERDKNRSYESNFREENIPPYTLPDALTMIEMLKDDHRVRFDDGLADGELHAIENRFGGLVRFAL